MKSSVKSRNLSPRVLNGGPSPAHACLAEERGKMLRERLHKKVSADRMPFIYQVHSRTAILSRIHNTVNLD